MNVGASSRPSGPSRRAEDADSMALLAVEVAITFLFKVYHTHLILLNFLQTSLMSCMPRSALPVWCVKLSYVVETANSSLCSLCQILCMIPQFLRSGLGCTTWTLELWHMLGLQIYLRIPLQPREDLAGWRSVLQNIMESSAAATRMVLVTLSCPSELRRRYVLLEETIIMGLVGCKFIEIDLFSPMACMCCCSASVLSHHKAKDSLPDLKGLLHGNCDCCFLFL